MTKIFVYAANKEWVNQAVQTLKSAGAEQVESLDSLRLSSRQPKENRYLFICETPAEKLAALMPEVLPESAYAQELGTWYECQNEILAAYNAHNKRSVLTTLSQLHDLNGLIEKINRQWGLSLNTSEKSETEKTWEQKHALLSYLVQNLIQQTKPLQALANQLAQLSGVNHTLVHETDALTDYRNLNKTLANLHAEKMELVSLADANNHQLKNSTLEIDNLRLELATAQQELNRIIQESKSRQDNAEKEKKELIAARDAQSHLVAERQKQIESLTKENADLAEARDDQIKVTQEAEEESELLLLQLHQVQEELEHYFLLHNDKEAQVAQLENRWQRVLKRHPEFFDYESITVDQVDAEVWRWSINGLEAAGLSRNLVEFETFIENGVLGIRFNKFTSENTHSLNSWPDVAKDAANIECIPVGKGEVKVYRAQILRGLSGTDLHLLKLIPAIMLRAMAEGLPNHTDTTTLSNAIAKFQQAIKLLPETFRYGSVSLKKNKVNPDYEHLWLIFKNAYFGNQYWQKFELRLGAAGVTPGNFSHMPKVEIPLIDGKTKPFKSWFEESFDDNGGKFEIRLDLKQKIYDTNTWEMLSSADKALVKNIVDALPEAIQNLKAEESASFSRPILEWHGLAIGCCKTLSNSQ